MSSLPSRVQIKKGERTRQEILAAAASVFIEKGFEGASVSDIAAQKGINQSLIYHYFKDKKALWKAVKEWLLADFIALGEAITEAPLKKKSLIVRLLQQLLYLQEHPDILRFILWQQLAERIEPPSLFSVGTIADAIRALQKQNEVDPTASPEHLALLISSLLQGALQKSALSYEVDLQEYLGQLSHRLERALTYYP